VRITALLALAGITTVAACDDGLGPEFWIDTPVTITVYSLARSELRGLPSAIDVFELEPRRVDVAGMTGFWDVAFSEENGQFVLLPPSWFPGVSSVAGIAVIEDQSFDEVIRAPGDSAAYSITDPVPVRTDVVYVFRSGRRVLSSCVWYAKAMAVALDEEAGRLEMEIVRNPLCGDRYLVPPDKR
jgi:hypothetical protein